MWEVEHPRGRGQRELCLKLWLRRAWGHKYETHLWDKSSGNVWNSPSMNGAFYGTAPSPIASLTSVASPLSLFSFFLTDFSLCFIIIIFFFRREIFDIYLCYKEKVSAWLLAFACSYIRHFLYCFSALHQNHSENAWVSKTKGWRNCSCGRRGGAETLWATPRERSSFLLQKLPQRWMS